MFRVRDQREQTDDGQKGAQLVELALALPIFLVFVFLIIDLSRLALAYSTVRSAAYTGARQAIGFNRREWPRVGGLFPSGGFTLDVGQLTSDLVVVPEFVNDPANSSWYTCMTNGTGDNNICKFGTEGRSVMASLYRSELQAIAIANSILSENIGGVSYPCDARTPSGRPGCGRCFTLRGDDNDYENWFQISAEAWVTKSLAVVCEYDSPILVASLMPGLVPEYITVSSKHYTFVLSYPDWFFWPGNS